MQSFEVKRGHGKTLENGGLKSIMEEEFGEISEEENLFSGSFKALKSIKVEFVSITEIKVETETDNEATPEDSLDAHQAYNRFMQNVTAFNAKQRIGRAETKQVFVGDKYENRIMLPISLSYDHRVVDGAEGARFCAHLRESLGKDFAFKLAV